MRRLSLDEMYECAARVARASQSADATARQHDDRRRVAREMARIINERRNHERTA
jgi:hypothetical protein